MADDVGATRTMLTPNAEALSQNLERFLDRWNANLRDTTLKQLSNITKHVVQGCLSGIPPGVVTNYNEALHRYFNPYFNKAQLGIQAGYALLCLLFWLSMSSLRTSNCFELYILVFLLLLVYLLQSINNIQICNQ